MQWADRIDRRFKLRDLRILMTVVECGTMGKAADRLSVSQPVVSKAIADTEHALGVRLLDRSPRGVEPTQYGRALIKRGVAIFDEMRQSIKEIESLADPAAGELRLGTTEAIAAAVVWPVINRMSRRNPRMAFHVTPGDPETLFRELTNRNVDIVIARMRARAHLPEDMDAEVLFYDRLVVATGAKNRWTRRRKIDLTELVNEPWALMPFESLSGSYVAEAFRATGHPPPRPTVSSSSANLRNEVFATGRFLTVVPAFSLRLPRKHPWLKALPVELPNARRPIAIFSVKNRSLSPITQLFLDRVRAITKPLANSK
jgi:DNA-binding transcriptional LysR family regulator